LFFIVPNVAISLRGKNRSRRLSFYPQENPPGDDLPQDDANWASMPVQANTDNNLFVSELPHSGQAGA
jgi:hypothetical protein